MGFTLDRPGPGPSDFTEILRERARRSPEREVFSFLADGQDSPAGRLTYAGLHARATSVAARLRALGLAGERVLLIYPPGLEFIAAFFGCLEAGVVAVPCPLPRPNRADARLAAVTSDCTPRAILTGSAQRAESARWGANIPEVAGLPIVATDALAEDGERGHRAPHAPDALAFLQYTSGSTSAPKGVAITRGNLLANSAVIRDAFRASPESRGVFWLPAFHDMGLIGGILQTVYCGGSSLLMSPMSFLQRPLRWLKAISDTRATISGGPNFAYDLCARKVRPEDCAGLDLSHWQVAFNGAEPVRPETLERFAKAFAPFDFRAEAFLPCYGLAESTLLVSGRKAKSHPTVLRAEGDPPGGRSPTLVGCGAVADGHHVQIADPETGSPCPEGRVGEIRVSGPSVARGYWGRDLSDGETFLATPEGRTVRTGDLGFLRDGELFVAGRLKDLIIVRGRNVYPQDLEWTVGQSHPALKPDGAAAFSVDIGGEERVVIVAETERSARGVSPAEILDAARAAVGADHAIDLHAASLIRPMSLPRTSSGKVRRAACREAFLAGTLDEVETWRDDRAVPVASPSPPEAGTKHVGTLATVAARAAGVLGIAIEALDLQRPLNTLGLDSLLAMELKATIEADLGTVLPLSALLDGPSTARLAELADEGLARAETPRMPAPARCGPTTGAEPLSIGQQSLWYAQQLNPSACAYNIAGAARIRAEVDPGAFERALARLAERHDALRSTFPSVDGRPELRVASEGLASLSVEGPIGRDESEIEHRLVEAARRPFDLGRGPLHRVHLWRQARGESIALLVIHHIVADFWSMAVLIDEFGRLYAAEIEGRDAGLAPLPLRPSDFARWQADLVLSAEGGRLRDFWHAHLSPPPPDLILPTDRPRPAIKTDVGGIRSAILGADLSRAILALGAARGASPYATLLAAFQVLLGRLSGQREFAVGSPVAGRTRPGLEGLIGYFVNLLPMRADLSGDPSFPVIVDRVREAVRGGLEHQDYPFGLMLQGAPSERDPSRTPIFQVMFIYQKAQRLGDRGLTPFSLSVAGPSLDLGGLRLESLALDKGAALFDLTLIAADDAGRIRLALEYNADLFDAQTADRLLGLFETLLRGIAVDPARPVWELPLLDEDERHRVLDEWGSAAPPSTSSPAPVHVLFEEQVARTPDAPAVTFEDRTLSYAALNERANALAHHLRSLGVGPDVVVGLCLPKSCELLVALLGVLKAGGAYLPLDPDEPSERLAFKIDDARASLLISTDAIARGLPSHGAGLVSLDRDASAIARSPRTDPRVSVLGDHLAYIIYTSGSTGRPKGVMVTHGGLANAALAWIAAYALKPGMRHLQAAGPAFDVFTGDWVRALTSGGTLIPCSRDVLLDPERLARQLACERIDCAEFVPAVMDGLLAHYETCDTSPGPMHLVSVGSDLWHAGQHERARRRFGAATRIVNSYGLTEATIDSSFFEGSLAEAPPGGPAPIGRPLAGTRLLVLDARMQPVPVGVPGELCVGGDGVARGYVGRPAPTAERFVPDPFGPPGSRLYRTGDVARWRPDGQLELLGRADRQVKVRGFRIELGEVEAALLYVPGIREAAVVLHERASGEKRLVGYAVAEGAATLDPVAIRRSLKDRLPDYMVPSSLVVLPALPLTPNGKVDRLALAARTPPPNFAASADEGPRTEIEVRLARLVSEALGGVPVGPHDGFFALGIDSILVIQIVSRARKAGLKIDPAQFFRHPTIADLAAAIGREPSRAEPTSAIQAAPGSLLTPGRWDSVLREAGGAATIEDAYPLTPVQEGMLFHTLADPGSGVYVEQFTCLFRGGVDLPAFERAWRSLIARHAALRTSFPWLDTDHPIEVVHRSVDVPLERLDWSRLGPDEQEQRLERLLRDDRRRGFALSLAPLFRLFAIRLGPDADRLIWSHHHAILDGWCMPILMREFLQLYEAERTRTTPALPGPRPYREYVAWLQSQDASASEAFWRSALAGFRDPTPLAFETPSPTSEGTDDVHEVVRRGLECPEAQALLRAAGGHGLTPSTLVQGAWAVLLARYSGREEVVFGVTVSGRPPELDGVETMIGLFINTLPLRAFVPEETGWGTWLKGLQTRQVEARRFEATSLVQIGGWSEVPRGRPLFESIVVFENFPIDATLADRAGGLGIEDVRFLDQTNYPIDLTVIPGDAWTLRLGFDPRRFAREAIERVADGLVALLRQMADRPGATVAELSLSAGMEDAAAPALPPDSDGLDLEFPDLDGLPADRLDALLESLRETAGGDPR